LTAKVPAPVLIATEGQSFSSDMPGVAGAAEACASAPGLERENQLGTLPVMDGRLPPEHPATTAAAPSRAVQRIIPRNRSLPPANPITTPKL
jgi:hypothetical protein